MFSQLSKYLRDGVSAGEAVALVVVFLVGAVVWIFHFKQSKKILEMKKTQIIVCCDSHSQFPAPWQRNI